MRIAVLDDYQRVAFDFADWSRVKAGAEVVVFDRNLATLDEAAAALADFDVICTMRERMPIPAALIERLPRLKLITITGAYNRTLDLAAAAARGVLVANTGNGSSQHPTAELTWALILAAARSVPQEGRRLREGGWQSTVGTTLHGRTLGVVGLGRLGKQVAAIGRAFGMQPLAWSPNLTADRAADAGARLVPKSELFEASDVVTLHMVLSERTRGLVGADDLGRMRDGAILVNTSRGPLIDEAALLQALRGGRISAGLDVFDQEPLAPDHPLRRLDNVVATPHLGYVSRETYSVFFTETVENLEAFMAGAPVRLVSPP